MKKNNFCQSCGYPMKKDRMNGILAWILTRGIPKLERWEKKDNL